MKTTGSRGTDFSLFAPSRQQSMTAELATDLVLCGLICAGLTLLAHHLKPALAGLTFYTGLAGGGMCALWGGVGRRWALCRLGGLLALGPMACVFGYECVNSWQAPFEGESDGRDVSVLMGLMVVFCLFTSGQLARQERTASA